MKKHWPKRKSFMVGMVGMIPILLPTWFLNTIVTPQNPMHDLIWIFITLTYGLTIFTLVLFALMHLIGFFNDEYKES